MRVAGRTVVRRYLTNLERGFSNKNKTENTITSNRKYSRASQNPIEASKALKVRKAMANLDTYKGNLETAKSIYETAESAVMKVSELIQATYEKLIYGANDTQGPNEDKILADTIRTFADEMVQLLNVGVADRTIFGGTGNEGTPFKIENNMVFYNNRPVNAFQDPTHFPNGGTSYTDIGIGMYIGKDGRIDNQSALPVTFNGAEIMGCGLKNKIINLDLENMISGGEYSLDIYTEGEKKTITFFAGGDAEDTADIINSAIEEVYGYNQIVLDASTGVITNNVLGAPEITVMNTPLLDEEDEDYIEYDQVGITNTQNGYSNNIIQLTLDAAACLEGGDKLGAAQFADALFDVQTNLTLTIADIGNKEEFIDFNLERITNNLYSMSELQNNYEGTDLPEAITTWKVMEAVYNASLQMSASVLPMTIFSFMN